MGPFIKSNDSTKKTMINLSVALSLVIMFSLYKNGYIPYSNGYGNIFTIFYPLLFILIGGLTSFSIETLYGIVFKKKNHVKNSYSVFPGIFLSLLLPINTPIAILVVGSLVASIVGKIVFGGFGKNIFNPALVGYIFIVIAFSSSFGSYLNDYEMDTISKSTPLTNSQIVGTSYDELVKPYGSLNNFFIGDIPGSIGETSALICLIAFVYLVLSKTIKWRIPIVYIGTVFLVTYIVSRSSNLGLYYPLFNILSGGLMFGAIFMATDPVTTPVTPNGQILFGLLLGILTCVFRFTGVEGVATSILIMNMFVFILDKIGAKTRINHLKYIIILSVLLIIILVIGIFIGNNLKSNKTVDTNFKIISKENSNNLINYTVTQRGYGGNIKALVVIENNKVKSIEILNHNETKDRYDLIMKDNYLNEIVTNQDNLTNLDTISSATITSDSLKKLVNNVLEDLK